jgi:hypothetical protein
MELLETKTSPLVDYFTILIPVKTTRSQYVAFAEPPNAGL